MSKVDIISGFLGAGKTTLIKKLIQDCLGNEKVVLIENEFGEIGIDGSFLKEAGIEIGKREMIMKMCDKGYTIAQIADVAGMDEKQIEDTIKMLNCYQYKRLNMI